MKHNSPSVARRALLFTVALCSTQIAGLAIPTAQAETRALSTSRSTDYVTQRSTTDVDRSRSTATRRAEYTQLQWNAPATRADGSKLYMGDIDGYRIYYKLKDQSRYTIITIHSASETSFSLSGFRPGTYEFYVSTLDTEGLESQPSSTVMVSVI